MVGALCTTKVSSSSVAVDSLDLFVGEEVSDNAALGVPDRTSALSILGSHKLAVVSPSCLEQSWIPLSPETSCPNNGDFWDKNLLELINRSC